MLRRNGWAATIAVLMAVIAAAASAAPASAERFGFAFGTDVVNDGNVCTDTCQPGRAGAAPAQFLTPTSATTIGDEVFVTESSANRVSVFDATSGVFKRAFGKSVGGFGVDTCTTVCGPGLFLVCPGTGSPLGCAPSELAVAGDAMVQPAGSTGSGGQLFVAEPGRVSVWTPAGHFVRAFGRGVGGPGIDSCAADCQFATGALTGAGEIKSPAGIAISGGEAFVADAANRRVFVFDATSGSFKRGYGKNVGGSGVDTCTTTCQPATAGSGAGQFGASSPGGVVVSDGALYVTDTGNDRILVFNAATGAYLRAIGAAAGSGSGELVTPLGMAIAGGELYVSDAANSRISVFDASTGAFRRALGRGVGGAGTSSCTTACQPGAVFDPVLGLTGRPGEIGAPSGLSIAAGKVFVTDLYLSRFTVLDAATGAPVYSAGSDVRPGDTRYERCRIVCQSGTAGSGSGELYIPNGLAVSGSELFVADAAHRINVYDSATAKFVRAFGSGVGGEGVDTCTTPCTYGTADDEGASSPISPTGIAIDAGHVFVTEQSIDRVSVFDSGTGAFIRAFGKDVGGGGTDVCTVLASCRNGTPGDDAGALDSPSGVAASGGQVFVADFANDRISVFNASTGAFVRAFGAGVGGASDVCTTSCQAGSGGSTGAARSPTGVAVAGNEVFVTELKNRRVSVFDATTGAFVRAFGRDVGGPGVDVCTNVCQVAGASDPSHPGAFFNPTGVAAAGGQLYVTDSGLSRVTVLDASTGAFLRGFGKDVGGAGIDTCTVSCALGGGGVIGATGYTTGDNARNILFPFAVAVAGGRVFVSESGNSRVSAWSSSPDATAPDTAITSGPGAPTNDSTPTFGFTSEAGAVFECKVDAHSWLDCASATTTSVLADGPHTFQVRAIDPVWNTDATPASRSFTVDTTPPETTITSVTGPVSGKFTLAFTSSETGSTFQCKVDSGAFAACSSPFTTAALSSGTHTFQVRATDAVGNQDATPAVRSTAQPSPPTFAGAYLRVVQSSGPAVLTGAARASTGVASVKVRFRSSSGGAFDRTYVATVSSPGDTNVTWSLNLKTLMPPLPPGSYTTTIQTTDVGGNVSAATPGPAIVKVS